MKDMAGPSDPRGFVVDWQLADAVAISWPQSLIDLSANASEHEVVLTDDSDVTTSSAG